MGLFKKRVVKEIYDGTWGHLVSEHKVDVDTLSRDFRCVDRKGSHNDKGEVTFLRVFKPKEAEEKGVAITGWETFDQHPDLVIFEGYITPSNNAFLERKRAS